MVGLKKQIKDLEFKNIYLFYGEENYLKNFYVNKLKEKIISVDNDLMNFEVIDKDFEENYIINSIETLPFLAERRMVIIKGSNFFSAKSSISDRFINLIKDFPKETIVIFVEDKVDRRNKLFKALKNNGYIVEFNYLNENDLGKWIAIELKKLGKKADYNTIIHLIRTVGINMELVKMEIDKLASYKLKEELITIDDIDSVCIKSVENRIFDLVDAMGMKKSEEALIIYNNLITMNEPPIRILIMLIRQFRLIYQVKVLMNEGYNYDMVAKKVGIPSFVAKKCYTQGQYFSVKNLEEALEECLLIDMSIKTGQMKDKLAVEMLLTKYSKKI